LRTVRAKICGIKSEEDLKAAIYSGAHAIGYNFYQKSIRFIDPFLANRLNQNAPPGITAVGVFANATEAEIINVLKFFPELQYLQLHGQLPDFGVLGSRRWIAVAGADKDCSKDFLQKEISRLCDIKPSPCALVVDSKIEGLMGGTGVVGPWDVIKQCDIPVPLILAGGINPENVKTAIQKVQPFMVDTASGVESSPGAKCPEKIQRFMKNVIESNLELFAD